MDFDLCVVQMKRDKDAEKKRAQVSYLKMCLQVQVILHESEIPKKTVKVLDEQLDLLQKFGSDTNLPKTKKARGLKPEKQQLLREALGRYQIHVEKGGETIEFSIRKLLSSMETGERPEDSEAQDGWEEKEAEIGD